MMNLKNCCCLKILNFEWISLLGLPTMNGKEPIIGRVLMLEVRRDIGFMGVEYTSGSAQIPINLAKIFLAKWLKWYV